jgi:cytochrome oxidase Cu insertion factor (SCO1/SenC/PrrC family)
VQPFPPFQLDAATGEVVTERDLRGHPTIVYLGRHPG